MLTLNEDVETTWAFIRMIEHWNENEWWRPFDQRGVSGEVSTFGRVRNCSHGVHIRRNRPDPRPYFNSVYHFPFYNAVLEAFIPKPHPHAMCDHIDRNTHNSRLSNLRWVSATLNQRNKTKDLVSGTGVDVLVGKRRTSYRVRISVGNVKIGLGTFSSMEEADARYKRAVRDAWEVLAEY